MLHNLPPQGDGNRFCFSVLLFDVVHNLPPQGDGNTGSDNDFTPTDLNTTYPHKGTEIFNYPLIIFIKIKNTAYPHKGTEIFWEKREYHKAKKTQLTPTRGRKIPTYNFKSVFIYKNYIF